MESISTTETWRKLTQLAKESISIAAQLSADTARFEKYTKTHADADTGEKILFDFSKNKITDEAFELLLTLADEADLGKMREAMFAGEKINTTENRAVLHTALRNITAADGKITARAPVTIDGTDVMPLVVAELKRLQGLVEQIRGGTWLGYTGKKINAVVNIGIGGSDLGPKMICRALRPLSDGAITPYFVSNIDGNNLCDVFASVDPERTLFIVVSKTFTTAETLRNAHSARAWLMEKLGSSDAVSKHFMAVSTNKEKVLEFGICAENMLGFWDWVGGRYSLWSAVGCCIAFVYGSDIFFELLQGAHGADCHFRDAPLRRNIPVLMGLLNVWYNNFCGAETTAILPYEHTLSTLPGYLQQADMESCGKQTALNGGKTEYQTGTVIWGDECTNGQHAFFQFLHQGTKLVPCDFIGGVNPQKSDALSHSHHQILLSNFFAQTEALLVGKTKDEVHAQLKDAGELERLRVTPHRLFSGNRPSTTILYDKLTPRTLGALVAFYEHKIYVQSIIWKINAFDQWGVELGKTLAVKIEAELAKGKPGDHDQSTSALLKHFCAQRVQ